jgi:hypothetical protein
MHFTVTVTFNALRWAQGEYYCDHIIRASPVRRQVDFREKHLQMPAGIIIIHTISTLGLLFLFLLSLSLRGSLSLSLSLSKKLIPIQFSSPAHHHHVGGKHARVLLGLGP